MKIAGSMSVGRIATKHTLAIDGVRRLSRNVDSSLTKDNEILVDELNGKTIEEYTNEIFQPVIDEYNAKQKRNDRKIKTSYVEWHKNNGNLTQGKMSLAYECVVQIGDHESLGRQYYESTGEVREKLRRWFNMEYRGLLMDFQKRFPHLKVLYAVIHFDEKDGTPHLHICFQPQAECSRGLGLQVSIGKALAQDGIKRSEDRLEADREGYQMTRMYREFHHDFINKRIREAGFSVNEEIEGRKHIDKSYFKDKMMELDKKAEEAQQQLEQQQQRIEQQKQQIIQQQQQLEQQQLQIQQKKDELKQEQLKAEKSLQQAKAEAQNLREQIVANRVVQEIDARELIKYLYSKDKNLAIEAIREACPALYNKICREVEYRETDLDEYDIDDRDYDIER